MSMAEVKWTDDQLKAIEHRGSTLLVSAAAGSGKTAVLVERLLRRVMEDGEDITRFLMITYTNAAASELREKILTALNKRASEAVKDAYLRRQLTLVHAAHISTIHAFCTSLLRTHGHLIGISGDYRIMDEGEAEILRTELCEEVIEEGYGKDWFMPAAQALFGERDDRNLAQAILELHGKSRSQVFPDKWLDGIKNSFSYESDGAPEDTAWGKYLLDSAQKSLSALELLSRRALNEIAGDQALEKAYLPAFISDREIIKALSYAVAKGWDAAVKMFDSLSFQRLGSLRKYENEEKKELVKAVRNQIKDTVEKLRKNWFLKTSDQIAGESQKLMPIAAALASAAQSLDEKFAAEKRRRNALDYSDLEHFALELLVEKYDAVNDTVTPTALAKEISEDWAEIMVDEYQDSNCIQDVIFRAVSKEEKNLVMVGDIKQSIYRFRLADPQIFLKKYKSFKPIEQAERGQACTVNLSRNFRSRSQVLDACNSLFSSVMSDELGDIKYTPEEYLYLGAGYDEYAGQSNAAEAVILNLDEMNETAEEEISPAAREIEAEWIAGRIRSMLDEGFCVQEKDGSCRKMRMGDVVILLRSLSDKAHIFEAALQRAGIACTSDKATGLLDTPEVSMIISLLTVIDNPLNEVALVGALRSPLFAFSADDLSLVRRAGGSYISAVEKVACSTEGETSEKCREFLKVYYAMRELSEDLSCDKLIWKLYCLTNALGIIGALPAGEQRRRNLISFFQYAQSFEENGFRGLYAFLERIARLAEKGDNISAQSLADTDAVRIMSIHKSKGLEFPIVFLVDFNHKFNTSDLTHKVIIHPELGLGLNVCEQNPPTAYPSASRVAVAQKMLCEMKSEEMRVLYVALTRAREKLIVVCSLPNAVKKLSGIYSRVVGGEEFSAEELNDVGPVPWLLAPLLFSYEGHEMRARINASPIPGAKRMNFDISIVNPETCTTPQAAQQLKEESAQALSMGTKEEFKSKFEYEYPYAKAAEAPSKITATGMRVLVEENCISADGIAEPEEKHRSFTRPQFVREVGLTPAEKGIAAHLAMQLVDFSKCQDLAGVKDELSKLYAKGQLTELEYQAVTPEMLMRFFASSIGKEVMAAQKLWREFRFSVLVPANHLAPGETMILQGVADLFFETEQGIVLVDFKTDAGNVEKAEAQHRYGEQLRAYAYALEQIFKKRVSRKVLFFLRSGKFVELD